jgi:hypothetical protein
VTVRGCVLKDVLRRGGGNIWSWKEQRVTSIYQHLEFVSKRDAPPPPVLLFSSYSSSFGGKKSKMEREDVDLFPFYRVLEEKTSNL